MSVDCITLTLVRLGIASIITMIASNQMQCQDYGRIDTIRYWSADHHVNYLQAYHDTIIAKIIIKDSDEPDYFDISYNGGQTWQYAMDRHQQVDFIPGTGSYVIGFDTVFQQFQLPTPQYFWIFRQGRIVNVDTIGYGHPEYPLYIENMLRHPTDPSALFYKAAVHPAGGKINYMYVSTNDGRSWRMLDVPPPTQGTALDIQIRFDFAHPSVWYFGVNGRDVFGAPDRFEWHKTTDSGQTFSRVNTLHFLTGLWGEGKTVSFPYKKQKPWHTRMSSGTPVVWDMETGESDTLKWIENIHSSLFQDIDTAAVQVYATAGLADETATNIGYHPDLPGMIVMKVTIDSVIGNDVRTSTGVAVTVDTGTTWSWAIRPQRLINVIAVSIDPMNRAIFISLNGNSESDDGSYMVLRINPQTVSSSDAQPVSPSMLTCRPNPASDALYLSVPADCTSQAFEIVDLFGRTIMKTDTPINSNVSMSELEVDVRNVATGRYFLILSHKGGCISIPISVLR